MSSLKARRVCKFVAAKASKKLEEKEFNDFARELRDYVASIENTSELLLFKNGLPDQGNRIKTERR